MHGMIKLFLGLRLSLAEANFSRFQLKGRERFARESSMVAVATLVGGALGFSAQLVSNGVRKLPLSRHPWEHVLAFGVGAYFANTLVKWEDQVQETLEESLEEARKANKRRFRELQR